MSSPGNPSAAAGGALLLRQLQNTSALPPQAMPAPDQRAKILQLAALLKRGK